MKRSEALSPLSREHLAALLVAKKLREAEDREVAVGVFIEFWNREGRRHFRIEEEVLLPWWAREDEVDRPGVARMLTEHLGIRTAALRLASEDTSLTQLHELGDLLHDHVRFEERSLFPRIEAGLDAEALQRLGAAIEQAEAEASGQVQAGDAGSD